MAQDYWILTGERANCKIGLVPGARWGKNGELLALFSMFDDSFGREGFMSIILGMPCCSILACNSPKSRSWSSPEDDFMCMAAVIAIAGLYFFATLILQNLFIACKN